VDGQPRRVLSISSTVYFDNGLFVLMDRAGYWVTLTCKVPLPPPEIAVAVIVTVPVLPPNVAVGDVVLVPVMLMMVESLELQFAGTFDVNPTLVPVPPLVVMLMEFPEQLPHVMVTACAPTVTESVPLMPLNVAVTVTGVEVF
jgi:hypothetical protein